MTDSRIHLLNNGLSDRQKKKLGGQNVTLDEVNQAFAAERVENEKMVKWYMLQIPELVARMLADAMQANGLTILPPKLAAMLEQKSDVSASGVAIEAVESPAERQSIEPSPLDEGGE